MRFFGVEEISQKLFGYLHCLLRRRSKISLPRVECKLVLWQTFTQLTDKLVSTKAKSDFDLYFLFSLTFDWGFLLLFALFEYKIFLFIISTQRKYEWKTIIKQEIIHAVASIIGARIWEADFQRYRKKYAKLSVSNPLTILPKWSLWIPMGKR